MAKPQVAILNNAGNAHVGEFGGPEKIVEAKGEILEGLAAEGMAVLNLDQAAFATWRHKHVVTVERIIGRRRGTGGTEGAAYLASTLTKRCFPELWSLRTKL